MPIWLETTASVVPSASSVLGNKYQLTFGWQISGPGDFNHRGFSFVGGLMEC